MNDYLKTLTPEQREDMRKKSAESLVKKTEYAKKHLKLDWEDDYHWRLLASHYGFRLPRTYEPAAGKWVNRFLKHTGMTAEWYSDITGFKNGNEEARVCKDLPAFAQIGILLEAYDQYMKNNLD